MTNSRKEEILDIAQHLTQERGLNGFSYTDISEKIGIKTSSIHYYFKTKDDLATALIRRYHKNLKLKLDEIISNQVSSKEKLTQFSDIFKELAETKDKFCLCGMMAAECAALSGEAKRELARYFQTCREWLSNIFTLLGSKHPAEDAQVYLSLMEGALLIARVEGQSTMMDEVTRAFIRIFQN